MRNITRGHDTLFGPGEVHERAIRPTVWRVHFQDTGLSQSLYNLSFGRTPASKRKWRNW